MRTIEHRTQNLIVSVMVCLAIVLQYLPQSAVGQAGIEYEQIRSIGRGGIQAIDWHPNQDLIAVGSNVGVWLYTSALADVAYYDTFPLGTIEKVSWSPLGNRLAVTGSGNSEVQIWEKATHTLLTTIPADRERYDFEVIFSWSPDESQIATLQGDSVVIWDISTTQPVKTFLISNSVTAIAWSPLGDYIAIRSDDCILNIWDVTNETVTDTIIDVPVTTPVWNPGGTMLAITQSGETLIWELSSSQVIATLEGNGYLEWTTIGLVQKSDKLRIWQDITMPPTFVFEQVPQGRNFTSSYNGQKLAFGSHDNNIAFLDIPTEQLTQLDIGHELLSLLSWSPGNQYIATTNNNNMLQIYDIDTGEMVHDIFIENSATAISWQPNNNGILSSDREGTIFYWNNVNELLITSFTEHHREVTALAWRSDSQQFASASLEGIKIWDPSSSLSVINIDTNRESIRTLAWNPDNQLLAGATSTNVFIWDATTGQLLEILTGGRHIAWSPDGNLIATDLRNQIVVYTKNGEAVATFSAHDNNIIGMSWFDNNNLVSHDTNLGLIWDINSENFSELHGELDNSLPVIAFEWSPGHENFASIAGGTIRIWGRPNLP